MGYFTNAGLFLLNTFFGLYIYAVLLRFMLQQVRANFSNPIAHFLVVITNPPLRPLRSFIPGLYGIDLASVVLLLLLELVFQSLMMAMLGSAWSASGMLVHSVFDLIQCTLNVYLFGILILVILSWVNPYPNPLSQLLGRLTEPVMRPARRALSPISGIDFSPMATILVLVLIQMAVPYLEHGTLNLLR